MSSTQGKKIKLSVFGESHGPVIGIVIDGMPAGEPIDMEALQLFTDRRAPGLADYQTARRESDTSEFLSGIHGGKTTGAPICVIIRNENTRSKDYDSLRDIPRPSHADYTAHLRYNGFHDIRGGGHFSGRLTAPLCAAGGLALQILARRGVTVGAHINQIASVTDASFDPITVSDDDLIRLGAKAFPVLDAGAGAEMQAAIAAAKAENDSIGGIVECAAVGFPCGIGTPMFDGIENRLASAIFGIPAVRGIEFGAGFSSTLMRGSLHNDAYTVEQGQVKTTTNNHGGVIGGISTGMPIIMRVAFKPTPSIGIEQVSVSLSRLENTPVTVNGRHDPCIVPRAVPCVEAVTGLVLLDMLLSEHE